jgi:septal ring factor EnvC (AmiA/AmiB activator)
VTRSIIPKLRAELAGANAAIDHAERRLRDAVTETDAVRAKLDVEVAARTRDAQDAKRAAERRDREHAEALKRARDDAEIAQNSLRTAKVDNEALAVRLAAIEAQRNRLQSFTDAIRKELNAGHFTCAKECEAVRGVVLSYVPNGYAGISSPATNRQPLTEHEMTAQAAPKTGQRVYRHRVSFGDG